MCLYHEMIPYALQGLHGSDIPVAAVSAAGDSVEIWAGTQSQTTATETPAKFLDIRREKVKLHDLLMGGGFGRRGPRDMDFLIDAVLLAKEAASIGY